MAETDDLHSWDCDGDAAGKLPMIIDHEFAGRPRDLKTRIAM